MSVFAINKEIAHWFTLPEAVNEVQGSVKDLSSADCVERIDLVEESQLVHLQDIRQYDYLVTHNQGNLILLELEQDVQKPRHKRKYLHHQIDIARRVQAHALRFA